MSKGELRVRQVYFAILVALSCPSYIVSSESPATTLLLPPPPSGNPLELGVGSKGRGRCRDCIRRRVQIDVGTSGSVCMLEGITKVGPLVKYIDEK